MNLAEYITVLIPTSPIPSHPSTAIIQETIASIRGHLPDCRINIMIDGLRNEQSARLKVYEDYKGRLDLITTIGAQNIERFYFDTFHHQAAMLKRVLPLVTTPLLLYVEHDTPLCEDTVIEWEKMVECLETGEVNSIRLHHYNMGHVPPEHEYLMLDKEPITLHGVRLIRTRQWSQRPHLARVDFYQNVMHHFTDQSRTMIEDRMYQVVEQSPWEVFRLSIYAPEGHMKRSRDLEGRGDQEKFEETFVY